jgi:phage anti-repressor protein
LDGSFFGGRRTGCLVKEGILMSTELSESVVFELIQSEEQFPINLDDAWQWLGYAEKRNALRLLRSRFKEGLDFSPVCTKTPQGGRPSDQYLLTVDCFKCLGMLAVTEKGDEIRRYFLQCERLLTKRIKKTLPPSPPTDQSLQHLAYLFSETAALLNTLSDSLALRDSTAGVYVLRMVSFNLSELERRTCVIAPALEPFSYPD